MPGQDFVDATKQVGDGITQMTEQYAQLHHFVKQIAVLIKEGELVDADEPRPFEWESDDAWETLQSLISKARELTGTPDRPTEDGETVR
jgi:hypothetical protein